MISSSLFAWGACALAPLLRASAGRCESGEAFARSCPAAKLCDRGCHPEAIATATIVQLKSRARIPVLQTKPPVRLRLFRKHAPCQEISGELGRLWFRA